ncbi:hypothetical protein H4219_004693, partial [Mycoemilia scoparia]
LDTRKRTDGAKQVPNVRTATLIQGRTTRWAIGWSFVAATKVYRLVVHDPEAKAIEWLEFKLKELGISIDCREPQQPDQYDDNGELLLLVCKADANTWSRAARRKALLASEKPEDNIAEAGIKGDFLKFEVKLNRTEGDDNSQLSKKTIFLLYPEHSEMNMKLESLVNHLNRSIGQRNQF